MKTASLLSRKTTLMATALLAALALALGGWAIFRAQSGPFRLTGESTTTTPDFSLRASRYALNADLLPGCQYTFYLTPVGGLWNRQGKAVASASGELRVTGQVSAAPGRYFIHAYTAPDEGCSWSLALRPLP